MLRLASLTSVLVLFGCANQGDEGMIVLNNSAITTTCTLSGSKSQPFIAHGTINARSPAGYLLTPLIESRVASVEGDIDQSQRTIFLTGANVSLDVVSVTIERADGSFANPTPVELAGQQAQFSSLFSASLPPSGTVNVGFDIIPPQTLRTILASSGATDADNMTAEVLATITILGKLGNDELESLPFQYPVAVCNHCVIVDNGACPVTIEPRTGNACNMFQDGIVDCCRDTDNSLVCPASVLL